MLLVLDSSVVVKWFSKENNSELALKMREDFFEGKHDFSIPDLLLIEIANALRFNKELEAEDVSAAVDSLLNMEMNVIVPSREILEKAVKTAFELDLTVYDSVYLAMSDVLKCTLITEDAKLAKNSRGKFDVKTLKEFVTA